MTGRMNATATHLDSVVVFEPTVFPDERGFLFESYTRRDFVEQTGSTDSFIQDNHARSERGVLRGLHYQLPPHAQGKLVRCVLGEVFDVAVDIRRSSDTFGHWFGLVLTADNRKQLWAPSGFAHGYLALSEYAEVAYKTTDYYAPEFERSIRWNDPAIGIDWPGVGAAPILTERDASAPLLAEAETFD